MNKQIKSIYIANALLLSFGALSASAMPEQTKATVSGVLTGPIVSAPLKDPAIRRAVELLSKERKAPSADKPKRQNKPDSPIGRRMILGGPEVIPM